MWKHQHAVDQDRGRALSVIRGESGPFLSPGEFPLVSERHGLGFSSRSPDQVDPLGVDCRSRGGEIVELVQVVALEGIGPFPELFSAGGIITDDFSLFTGQVLGIGHRDEQFGSPRGPARSDRNPSTFNAHWHISRRRSRAGRFSIFPIPAPLGPRKRVHSWAEESWVSTRSAMNENLKYMLHKEKLA